MKKLFYGILGTMTGILLIFGLLYAAEKHNEKKIGGKLVKVNYRYSKVFDD